MSSRPAKAAASTMCSCEPLSSEDTVDLKHRLLGMTTSKSEDIMIHAGSGPFPQHCRLRASIPGRLWRWKEISEWTWKHAVDQINRFVGTTDYPELEDSCLHARHEGAAPVENLTSQEDSAPQCLPPCI